MSDCILQVRDLNKSYGAVMASRKLCFDIRRGEVHALIGPNGAGKTTAVNQLSGEIFPDSGSIPVRRPRDRQDAAAQTGQAGPCQIFPDHLDLREPDRRGKSAPRHNRPQRSQLPVLAELPEDAAGQKGIARCPDTGRSRRTGPSSPPAISRTAKNGSSRWAWP